jgi:hypothetical protein
METKKVSKIRENVRQFQAQGKQFHVHHINMEGDPIDYHYNSATPTCIKFVVGQEATYTVSDDNFGNKKISPVQPQGNPAFGGKPAFGGGGFKKETKDGGLISWLSCFSSVCNLYAGSPTANNFDQLLTLANKAFDEANRHSSLK